jgi:nucleoside-diphosphate-sugar epimerase
MAGTLRKLTGLPIVPLVGGQAHQFTLHEDDLRAGIVALAVAEAVPPRPLGLAHPEPVPFEQLLRAIARAGGHGEPRFVPIPWAPLYWAMRTAELTPIELPLRADSLLGLVRSAPSVPNPQDLEELGIKLRPFDPGG